MLGEGNAAAAAAQVRSVSSAGLCVLGAAEDGSGRAEGQPCSCLCPWSPAPGRVAQPGQESGACPGLLWPWVPAAGMGISMSNWCRSECLHPARSERLGSGSCEVIICLGCRTGDTGMQERAQPQPAWLQRRWARGHGVSLRWEHSVQGEGRFGGSGGMHPEVGGFPRAGRWGHVPTPGQTLQLPLVPGAGGRAPVPVRWRRDGALRGSVPGMHNNKPHLGSPVLVFRLAREQSPPSEKPPRGASRIPPAGMMELAPSLPSHPSPSCRYQRFSCTKKSTNFLIVSCWS